MKIHMTKNWTSKGNQISSLAECKSQHKGENDQLFSWIQSETNLTTKRLYGLIINTSVEESNLTFYCMRYYFVIDIRSCRGLLSLLCYSWRRWWISKRWWIWVTSAMVSHRLHIHEVFSLQVGHSDTGNKVAPQPRQQRLFGILTYHIDV